MKFVYSRITPEQTAQILRGLEAERLAGRPMVRPVEQIKVYDPRAPRMKVAYISGKYRASNENDVHENIELARRTAIKYLRQCYAVICPHMNTANMGGVIEDDLILDGDLELVRRCDLLVMLPNWRTSAGAKLERGEAMKCGIPIIYEMPEPVVGIEHVEQFDEPELKPEYSIGVDCAEVGGDSNVFTIRRGAVIERIETMPKPVEHGLAGDERYGPCACTFVHAPGCVVRKAPVAVCAACQNAGCGDDRCNVQCRREKVNK